MKFLDEGQLIRLAVLAGMGVPAFGTSAALAQAITLIDGDLEVTCDAQVDGDSRPRRSRHRRKCSS